MATARLADVQFTSTLEQFDVLQMRYSGEPPPLTPTVALQAAAMPEMATIFDEYCVDRERLLWSVKAKKAGALSQLLLAVHPQETPSQTSTHEDPEL
jgi:hypothetical protein